MEFRILGPMEVADAGGLVKLPSGRARSLIALLALHAGHPITAERLIDELWGEDPPATATTVIQGLVSKLRKVLEPDRAKGTSGEILETIGSAYRLAVAPSDVDAHRFTALIEQARSDPPESRAATLTTALGLWRGPALADFTYEPFAQRAIATLKQSRIDAIELRIETELALGRDAALVADLRAAIAEHPFRERLRGLLMIALYRAGRQAEALDAYHAARGLLLEEMGLEPGQELRELEQAILRQDSDLALEPARRAERSSWIPDERRRVTVVAVDVAPDAGTDVDPEQVTRIADHAADVATEVLQRHGARVERSHGDRVIAFFGFPSAREDDSLRAVKAALEMRTAVHGLEDPSAGHVGLRVRAGIETGEVIVGPGASLAEAVRGPLLSTADRLQHAARDADVLVGPNVQGLLRGAVIVRPADGPDGAGQAWRVLEVAPKAQAIPRTFDGPMIGREEELTRLRSAFRRAQRNGSVVAMMVEGEAGLGKSRLAREVVARLGPEATALILRCPPPGDPTGFFPVRQAVVEAAGIEGWRRLHDLLAEAHDGSHTIPAVADGIMLRSPPARAGELFAPLRLLFETLAQRQPLIVVLEDLQWADAGFVEAMSLIAHEGTGPILILCLARFDEEKNHDIGERVRLEPLDSGDIARLAVERAGSLGEQALARVVQLSEGNPLFAEQLITAIREDGLDTIPVSLAGLLSMRLDRLGTGERDVLRVASIGGLEVEIEVVEALLPDVARPFLERHLETLEQRRLIQRFAPRSLRFAHALIHMATVQTMTRVDRARLSRALSTYLDHAG